MGRGIALLCHDRSARRGMSGQQHAPAALYPRERHGTRCTGGYLLRIFVEMYSQIASSVRLRRQQYSTPLNVFSSQYEYVCHVEVTIFNVVEHFQYFGDFYCFHLHGRLSSC